MKKRFFLLVIGVVLICGLLGGATYAYFSDQATNSNNTFTAGTLDINVDRNLGDPIPGPMFYTVRSDGSFSDPTWPDHATGLWYPSREETRQLIVTNTGTIHFRVRGFEAVLTGIGDPAVADEFADEMNVKIYVSNDPSIVLYNGSLAALLTGEQVINPESIRPFVGAQPSANLHLSFSVKMHEDAGNNLQGVLPLVSFNVFAEQIVP